MASRSRIRYKRVPTDEEEEEDDYYPYEECCPKCCPLRFGGDVSHRSNNHFYGIQGSQLRDTEKESLAQATRGGASLIRWSVAGGSGSGSGPRRRRSDSANDTPTNERAGRQQSVTREPNRNGTINGSSNGNNNVAPAVPVATHNRVFLAERPPRADAAMLAALTRDVFIIPVAYLDRFLPAGVPRPFSANHPANLTVLEVEDPKQCVMIHLMGHFKPVDPLLESPLARPLFLQRASATELLIDISHMKTSFEGLLLSNMERNAEFPFISFFVVNKTQEDPFKFFRILEHMTYEKYDPIRLRYRARHTLDIFSEVATIARPPLIQGSRQPLTKSTGYIIGVYKVFEGDDGERFEQNWLYWTGARMLYYYLPRSVGLRRITLHKSVSEGDKTYVLLCECSNFLEDLSAAAVLIPALRGRLCGCTGLYRASALF